MSTIAVSFYGRESYEDIYATLARLFPPKSNTDGTVTWVTVPIDNEAALTFFAPDAAPEVQS